MNFIKRLNAKSYALLFWQLKVGDVLNSVFGLFLFYKYNFDNEKNLKTKDNFRAYLLKQYHIVEKGLALPNPRKHFGENKILQLLDVSNRYVNKFGKDDLTQSISSTLETYLNQNEALDSNKPFLFAQINQFLSKNIGNKKGGLKKISKHGGFDFTSFVRSRSSLRNFSGKPIDRKIINLCLDDAKYCPSVCNRQGWKAHYYDNRKTVLKLLNLQDGNNGFTKSIKALFVITSDLSYFTNLEYNQVFVEGGIFSMNLVHSLHARGIGSCCLNLCVPFVREKIIKKTGSIEGSERLIMMIGIGYYNDENLVAFSNRKNTDEILQIH